MLAARFVAVNQSTVGINQSVGVKEHNPNCKFIKLQVHELQNGSELMEYQSIEAAVSVQELQNGSEFMEYQSREDARFKKKIIIIFVLERYFLAILT